MQLGQIAVPQNLNPSQRERRYGGFRRTCFYKQNFPSLSVSRVTGNT